MPRPARRLLTLTALALLALAAGASPAPAAPLSGVLATDASDGAIAAYSSTAAWNHWDDAAQVYRIVVDRGGRKRTLGVAPSQRPFGLSAGRGPDGNTWLVWARCAGDQTTGATACDIEGYDLGTSTRKAFPFAARTGVQERAPSIDGTRLVYVTGAAGAVPRVHLAASDGTSDRIIDVIPPSTCALSIDAECFTVTQGTPQSSAIRGGRVAVTSRVSTGGGDFGICGLTTVRLLDLNTSAVRTLDDSICGLSGQTMGDTTFDADGRLWWRLICGGDPSACQGTRAGPYRQISGATQRLVTSAASRLAGVAVATRTPIVGVRAPFNTPACTTAAPAYAYRCVTITAIAAPTYAAAAAQREILPPPGYVTVRGTSRVRILRPPARMACSRGDTRPSAGATLWAGVSWLSGTRRTSGPAVPVTATSGHRTVRRTIPGSRQGHEGQVTTTLDLGGPSSACGRTWSLTYRPPGINAMRVTTRVLPR